LSCETKRKQREVFVYSVASHLARRSALQGGEKIDVREEVERMYHYYLYVNHMTKPFAYTLGQASLATNNPGTGFSRPIVSATPGTQLWLKPASGTWRVESSPDAFNPQTQPHALQILGAKCNSGVARHCKRASQSNIRGKRRSRMVELSLHGPADACLT